MTEINENTEKEQKSNTDIYTYLSIIRDVIRAKKEEMGFIVKDLERKQIEEVDLKDWVRRTKEEMINDIVEIDVYNELINTIMGKSFNEAWDKFKKAKLDDRFNKNSKAYKKIFKKIYMNMITSRWKPNEVIEYVKQSERSLEGSI